MKNCYLELIPENVKASVKVGLNEVSPNFNLGEAYKNKIYSDRIYTAKIDIDKSSRVADFKFYINGYKIDSTYSNGNIYFKNYKDGRIFIDNFGFVQMILEITFYDGEVETLYSDYLNIMIKNGMDSNNIKNMANYVYKYQEKLLFDSEMLSNDVADIKKSGNQSLESQLEILRRTLSEYKSCFKYFKNNAKFSLKANQIVDDFEKLKDLSSTTLEYIVQHPEQLTKSNGETDIVIDKESYLPKKVVTNNNIKSYDIYENNIIVNFLYTLIISIEKMILVAQKRINDFNFTEFENDYQVSASIIYGITKKKIEEYVKELYKLKTDFISLYKAYYSLLPCKREIVLSTPKATHTFLSIKFYNRIYSCIFEWYEYGIYDLSKEDFLVPFLVNSQLYEYYVLIKLYNFIVHRGYVFEGSKKYNYHKGNMTRYNNTFYFKSNEKTFTLYYQPIVDISERKYNNDIYILRNNDITSKRPYIPDYILKIVDNFTFKQQYVIFDAKFSTLKNVKNHYYYDLAFKYLFSFSTIDDSQILGLCAINGKSSEEVLFKSIYSDRFSKTLLPFANILTIAENGNTDEVDDLVHFEIIEKFFADYIDEQI